MAKANAFDAASLDTTAACNKPFEVEIKHPTSGESAGMFINVLGSEGDAYQARVRTLANETLRRQAMGKSALADATLDKLEQKNIDALVAATVSWRSVDDPDHISLRGERLEFNPANARKLYTEIKPIRDQVAEAINNLGNFMPA